MPNIEATAWTNGTKSTTGAGYGVTISAADRDRYFDRRWSKVKIYLGDTGQVSYPNVDKDSLWTGDCLHLIQAEIGKWMIAGNFVPWPRGRPPRFKLTPREPGAFRIDAR
jgi:hypothetical protein